MALPVADFNYTTEAIDGDSFLGTFTDETVYAGSDYARADVAVLFTIDKIAQDTESQGELTIQSYTPTSATTFSFTIDTDGWHKAKGLIIPEFNIATAYTQYQAVYYTNGNVYRATASSTGNLPTDTNYFELIADPFDLIENDGEADESDNISFEVVDIIIYPYAKQNYGIVTAQSDCCSDCEKTKLILNYEFAGNLVDSMDTANQQQRYAYGESIAREAEVFFATAVQ